MNIQKKLGIAVIPLVLSSLLLSQSLTDAAKKEKERREALKGKKTVAVTNADLGKLKKQPAFIAAAPPAKTQEETAASPASKAAATTGSGTALSTSLPMGVGSRQTESSRAAADKMNEQTKADLEEKYNKAREYRELLELKMNALQQQFFNMADTKAKELIQKDISDTYAKLLGAQEAETKAREDLEKFLGQSLKDKISPIWIK